MAELSDYLLIIGLPSMVALPFFFLDSQLDKDRLFSNYSNSMPNGAQANTGSSSSEPITEEKPKGPCPDNYLNRKTPLKELISTYQTEHPEAEMEKAIHVKKQCRLVTIMLDDVPIKQYDAALGSNPDFDKSHEGDRATPVGTFYVADKDLESKGQTAWYKALHISYPNKEDAARGLRNGLIKQWEANAINKAIDNCQMPPQNTQLGSLLKMHGKGGYISSRDWTWGCVGLDNSVMDEVYAFADKGCRKDGTFKTKLVIEY
ncbi:L,D-transpeptidase family protein [archaeon]|jgi:hypothetical protein|nr:L,D-transpeptidase family protein [archaeon]MBT6762716.1 L,D-transpeptidase family protein [archaeon]